MPHEGNSENTFSLSGKLSNPNTHTGPDFLSRLVRMNKNKVAHKPTTKRLRALYRSRYGHSEDGEEVCSDDDDNDSDENNLDCEASSDADDGDESE